MFNGRIKVLVQDIVRLLKIKLIVLLTKTPIICGAEGWNTCEVYVNGFSTSLPEDIQFKALSSVGI
jgi:tRNA uridine 5-carboxymethylaminomethyl modification enzyme